MMKIWKKVVKSLAKNPQNRYYRGIKSKRTGELVR